MRVITGKPDTPTPVFGQDMTAVVFSPYWNVPTNIALDVPGLEYAFRRRLEKEAEFFASKPTNLEMVQKLTTLLKFASTLPFPMVLWEVQNICYRPIITTMDELSQPAQSGDEAAKHLFDALAQLRESLRINGQ